MPPLSVRWSEQEARKPYARPFMVSFTGDGGEPLGAVAVSGADLLYYRQLQVAVLALAGELFVLGPVEAAGDLQAARLEAPSVLEYQELQAAIAHQTGRLYRRPEVEAQVDPEERQRIWLGLLGGVLARPGEEEAMAPAWPWRPPPSP